MFKKIASNILIEAADDCYISSLRYSGEKQKKLDIIAKRLVETTNKLVEGDVLALLDKHV